MCVVQVLQSIDEEIGSKYEDSGSVSELKLNRIHLIHDLKPYTCFIKVRTPRNQVPLCLVLRSLLLG
jgi:hypothetical protein